MNKNELKGFEKVLKFTFLENIKSKSYKFTILILFIITLISIPAFSFIKGLAGGSGELSIKEVYVISDNDELIDSLNELFKEDETFKDLSFKNTDLTYDEAKEDALTGEESDFIYMYIECGEENSFETIYNSETADENDVITIVSYLESNATSINYYIAGLFEYAKYYDVYTDYSTYTAEEILNANEYDDTFAEFNNNSYWLCYIILFGVMLFCTISAEIIATSIVTEKASKIVENLIISLKPAAILSGKIIALMLSTLLMFVSLIAGLLISVFIGKNMSGDAAGGYNKLIEILNDTALFQNISVLKIIVSIIMIVFGLAFFAAITVVSASSVSKIEDVAEGMKVVTLLIIIGMYACLYVLSSANMGEGANELIANIIYMLPISSPFIVPAFMLLGYVSLTTGIISTLILIVATALVFILASRIYGYFIFYNGEPLKLKKLINLSKELSKGGKTHE